MVNIYTLAKLITDKNKSQMIFYSEEFDRYFVTSNLELLRAENDFSLKGNKITKGLPEDMAFFKEHEDDFYELFDYDDDCLNVDVQNFIDLNKDKFLGFDQNKITFSKFKKYIKQVDLYDNWLEFFAGCISYETYYWTIECNLKEEEATNDQYLKVRKLLDIYFSKGYEQQIKDNALFINCEGFNFFSFIVLGNAGITRGINIIFDMYGEDLFKLQNLSSDFSKDVEMAFSLVNMISFYKEDDEPPVEFENNVYGNDNLITSIHVVAGNQSYNKLPKSVCLIAIGCLEKIIKYLDEFKKQKLVSKIDNDFCYEIDCGELDNNIDFIIKKSFAMPDDIPYDFYRDDILPFEKINIVNDELDFSIRKMNEYISDDDPRVMHFVYAALLANHNTGEVVNIVFGIPNLYYPLLSLSEDMHSELKDFDWPKNIYVNSAFDMHAVMTLFEKQINSKKIKINFVEENLKTDEAFASLEEELAKEQSLMKA